MITNNLSPKQEHLKEFGEIFGWRVEEINFGESIKIYNKNEKIINVTYEILFNEKIVGIMMYNVDGSLQGFKSFLGDNYPLITVERAKSVLSEKLSIPIGDIPNLILVQSGVYLYWKITLEDKEYYVSAFTGEFEITPKESSGLESNTGGCIKEKPKKIRSF